MKDASNGCNECKTGIEVEVLDVEISGEYCEVDEGEMVELAVIEELVKVKKKVPVARIYRLRIDKKRYDIRKHLVSGSDILALADKKPDAWKLYQHIPKQQPSPVGPDEIVDLRAHGIERFTTMAKRQQEGEEKAPRAFALPAEDAEYLNGRGLTWETLQENSQWLLIHGWTLPSGYNLTSVSLALLIPSGYPDVEIDMVYVHPHLSRLDGKPIRALAGQKIRDMKWQRWSRHRTPACPWRPGIDDISTHLTMVDSWFREELSK